MPIPSAVLPFMPKKITGPLFHRHCACGIKKVPACSLRHRCGITDPRKTTHSLRHRAADKLAGCGSCPTDIRYAILGHEKKTIADGYGAGLRRSGVAEMG